MHPSRRYRSEIPVVYDRTSFTEDQAARALALGLGLSVRRIGVTAGGWPVYAYSGPGADVWTLFERVSADAPNYRVSMSTLAKSVIELG